ncbi:GPI-anchored cell wall organization protein ecm33 [Xylariales sp. PMI_506]|nr:GPI-anchored cell wall organization protein ecm33 [Xylariales sp. PMI_506]
MFTKQIAPAVAVLGMAIGATAFTCKDDTITITSASDASTLAACETATGDVVISTEAGSTVDFSGSLTKIEGALTVENNGGIVSLSCSSLETIGGAFTLKNVTLLSTLSFTSLTSVGSIAWSSLNALGSLTFGDPGVTSADSVVISDTFLSTLDGIDVQSLTDMDINNNRYLTDFTSSLSNLSGVFNVNANGQKLSLTLPNLIWIANMTISNVTEFSAQSLAAVNGSMSFDANYFTTFSAPNLTTVGGALSFIGNSEVTNITMPVTSIGGGFTIVNNTALTELNGFPDLKTVGGEVLLRGNFDEVTLPSLSDVRGAFDLSSTGDISSSCTAFDKLSPSQGAEIQGSYHCTSNNANANNDTSSEGTSDSGTNSTKNAAMPSASGMGMSYMVSLVAIAGFVTVFL